MEDESSANKFIRIMLEAYPNSTFKARTYEGQTFKSKGYDNAIKKFEETMSKKLKEQLKSEDAK